MSFRRCLSGGGDIFSKSVEKQGGANRTFATGGRCHGWQLEPCPCGLEPLLTFRQKIPTGRPYIETCVSHAPGVRGFCQCISLTLKLVWCKNSKNNEFRTKKFPNPEFLYGISSFCTLSENNSFLHGKISCFCIFFRKNSVFNTNRTPRVTLHQLRLAACSK